MTKTHTSFLEQQEEFTQNKVQGIGKHLIRNNT